MESLGLDHGLADDDAGGNLDPRAAAAVACRPRHGSAGQPALTCGVARRLARRRRAGLARPRRCRPPQSGTTSRWPRTSVPAWGTRSSIGWLSRCWAASTRAAPTSCPFERRCRRSRRWPISDRCCARYGRARTQPSAGPVFAGLAGGVGRLAEALTASLAAAGADIVLDTTVRELARLPAGWELVTGSAANPKTINADAVVLALPAAPASRLLAATAPLAAQDLAAIDYASMAIVTLAFSAAAFEKPLTGSGFLVPAVDGRLIKAATFSTQKWGWYDTSDGVLVRCSIGRSWRRRRSAAIRRRAGRGRGARSRGGGRGPRAYPATRSSRAGAVGCRSTASATLTGSPASRRRWRPCLVWSPAERRSTASGFLRALAAGRRQRPSSSRSCSARENRPP